MAEAVLANMESADLDPAAALVAAEGWVGETRSVFADFLARDPSGCRVARQDGRLVGVCIATAYSRSGFIGELVVAPACRKRGLGTRLFRDALNYLDAAGVTAIYLDGDPPALPIYAAAGFQRLCRSLRFRGRPAIPPRGNTEPIPPHLLQSVLAMDREHFREDRGFFLSRCWRADPRCCRMIRREGTLHGYVFARMGRGVLSVGPLAADGEDSFLDLLTGLAAEEQNLPLRLGVLENNRAAVDRLRRLPGMNEEPFSWRMCRGTPTGLGESPFLTGIGSAAAG